MRINKLIHKIFIITLILANFSMAEKVTNKSNRITAIKKPFIVSGIQECLSSSTRIYIEDANKKKYSFDKDLRRKSLTRGEIFIDWKDQEKGILNLRELKALKALFEHWLKTSIQLDDDFTVANVQLMLETINDLIKQKNKN